MKWEQERVGWVGGNDRQVSLKRVEEFEGTGQWSKFGCYVLVERFVLKRMDGSLVLMISTTLTRFGANGNDSLYLITHCNINIMFCMSVRVIIHACSTCMSSAKLYSNFAYFSFAYLIYCMLV